MSTTPRGERPPEADRLAPGSDPDDQATEPTVHMTASRPRHATKSAHVRVVLRTVGRVTRAGFADPTVRWLIALAISHWPF
jgi:hypothetical protein